MKPLRVEMQEFSTKVIGWLGMVFWSICCVGCAATGPSWGVIEFACFMALSAYLVLVDYPREVMADSEGIWAMTSRVRYEIKWSEVSKIEFDMAHSTAIVLHGPDKKLALCGPAQWKPEGQAPMLEFIESQIKAWNIPREQTKTAAFQVSRNTKIALPKRPKPPVSL